MSFLSAFWKITFSDWLEAVMLCIFLEDILVIFKMRRRRSFIIEPLMSYRCLNIEEKKSIFVKLTI